MAFKNNYKDDILDLSVNEKRKYEMTTNADGTVSFEDRSVYEQIGDTFGAKELNEISEKLNISGERIRYNTSNNMVEIMDEEGNWNPWSSGISEEFIIKENSILPGTEYKNITINLQGEFVRFISQDSGKIMFYCDLTAYNGKYLRINLKADYEVKVCKCYGISSSCEIIKSIQPNSEFNNYYIPIDGNFDTNYKYLMLIFETSGFYDFKYISITASDGTGGGGTGSYDVELTQAEYDALPDTKLTDNKNYFIKDGKGGGSGSGYSETLLFDNTEKKYNGTFTLTDSFLNYDQIVFEVTNNNSNNWNVTSFCPYLVSAISDRIGGQSEAKGLFLVSVASAWLCVFLTTETSITTGEGGAIIKRIYGIKY